MRIFSFDYEGAPLFDTRLIPAVAERFRVLGDPGRLVILAVLQGGEKSVSEIVEATGRSQPNVSQHIASLARAGFVAARREGNRTYYRVVDPCVNQICDAVCQSLAARASEDQKWQRLLKPGGRKVRA
jgi:DNA-binding transcriptional ArsR family regulator